MGKKILLIFVLLIGILSVNAQISKMINDDVLVVLRVDYKHFIQTDAYLLMRFQSLASDKTSLMTRFAEETGFVPEKNLSNMYVIIDKNINKTNGRMGFVFDGQFDSEKTAEFFAKMSTGEVSFTKKIYNENIFYVSNDNSSYSFFSDNILVMGNFDYVKDLYSSFIKEKNPTSPVKKTDKKTDKKTENKPEINKISDFVTGKHDYLITGIMNIMPETRENISNSYPQFKNYSNIDFLTVKSNIGETIDFSLDFVMLDKESAKSIGGSLGNMKIMGMLYLSRFGLNTVLSKFNHSYKDEKVTIEASLTKEDIAKITEFYNNNFNKQPKNEENNK